jgi:hypothetical protein
MKFDLIQTRILKGVAIIALTLISTYMVIGLYLGGALLNGVRDLNQTGTPATTTQQGDPGPAPTAPDPCPSGFVPNTETSQLCDAAGH